MLKQPGEKIREHSFVDVDENSINFNFRQIASAKVHPLILPPINFQYPRLYCTPNVPFHPLYHSLSLSLSFPPSFSLSLSIAYSDPYTGHSHSFCTRARIHVYTRSLMPKRCFASQTLLTSRSPTIDKMLICLEKANYTQSKHVEFGETCLIRSLARLIRRDNEARKKFFSCYVFKI